MNIIDGLCYDDVLLKPKHSKIPSRADISVAVDLGKEVKLNGPFISANMKTVTGPELAKGMFNYGMGILHRFASIEEQVSNYKEAIVGESWIGLSNAYSGLNKCIGISVGISVGISSESENDVLIQESGTRVVCIDVAHGDHDRVMKETERLAKKFPEVLLIVGNVATGSGAKNLRDAGADVIKVGVGPGCFAAGTRILMANGTYKNIEDVKAGDRIINKDGQPKNVLKSFSTGIRRVSKVRNSIFYKDTFVTHDHKYFVGDLDSVSKDTVKSRGYAKVLSKPKKNGDSKFGWQEIGSQTEKCLLMPRNIKFELPESFSHNIKIRDGGNGHSNVKTKVDFSLKPSYELGYIFGTFLGDGHAMLANNGQTDIGAVYWYFGLGEGKIALKLRDAIKSVTGRDLVLAKGINITKCILYHKTLAEFLTTFGKKTEKHLPEKFIVNNQPYLQGIFDGLIDSDGNIEDGGRVCLKNTSPQLIELFNIVTYLLTEVFPNNQKGEISTGNLKGANIANFNTPYVARINKTASNRLVDAFQVSKLLEYSETEEEVEVFDLTIDCDTHSFIANNAIVHNSLCTTRIETGCGVPQLTALIDVFESLGGDHQNRPKIIADGGIKEAGDVGKALCFSDAVMLGSVLAGTDEAPGEVITVDGLKYKKYAGSSTHKTNRVEGVAGLTPYKGPMKRILEVFKEGLQSTLSYQGCDNLTDLRECPEFVRISAAGMSESKPHANIIR